MKPAILVFLLITVIVSSPTAQIHDHIGDYQIDVGWPSMAEPYRIFVGEFDFVTLPEPLKPTKVNFTLETTEWSGRIQDADWTVKLGNEPKYMRVLGESEFFWPAPHNPGDRFSGSFEFVPLISGYWEFRLHLPGYRATFLPVGLCFDPEGNLTYLGKQKRQLVDCDHPMTTFFNDDSVHIIEIHEARTSPNHLFSYEMTIKPPFRIDDTSTVVFRFQALDDFPDGVFMRLESLSAILTGLPDPIAGPVHKGDSVIVRLTAVPLPVTDYVHFYLELSDESDFGMGGGRIQTVFCKAVYNADGSLRMVGDDAMSFGHPEPTDLYPSSFRPRESRDYRRITIEPTAKSKD